MVVLISNTETLTFDSYKAMFQKLSEEGKIISSIKDGEIVLDNKDKLKFGEVVSEKSAEKLKEDVSLYRAELKEYVTKLKKQGINIPKEELEKLGKQFSFVK